MHTWQCRGGDVIVLHGGLYRRCRGEWKLARVSAVPGAFEVTRCVWWRETFQSPLQLRGGALG